MVLPNYDQLYIISDLHFGGRCGLQIFKQGETLAAFIQQLTNRPSSKVGLVLNGDIVDFLAEENATYLDPVGALDKLGYSPAPS